MYLIVWLSFYYYIFFVSFCLTTPKRECSCTFRTFWPNRSLEVQFRKIIFHLLQSVCLLILFDTQTSFTAISIYDEEHSVYHRSWFNFFFQIFVEFHPVSSHLKRNTIPSLMLTSTKYRTWINRSIISRRFLITPNQHRVSLKNEATCT